MSITAGITFADSDPAKVKAPEKAETAAEGTLLPYEGILLPYMSPAEGRKLFASKGCVVCHAINGIGGEDAPPLDAATMPAIMDPFDFAAKMWQGAGTMITMQEDELGEQIEFTGKELANIIAFVHSASEQKNFVKEDIPPRIAKLMKDGEEEEEKGEEHEKKEPNQ